MNTNQRTDFKSAVPRRWVPGDGCDAFTLTELLVVLATLGILAVVLLPALASTQKGGTKAFQCLYNMRQMGVAWTLYAGDNNDRLVNNYDVSNVQLEEVKRTYGSWANDFINWNLSESLSGLPNTNYSGLKMAPFYNYVGDLGTYKCPADNYQSAIQIRAGGPLSWRPRSYSMNCYFGATTPSSILPRNQFYTAYRQFFKIGQIPSPANIYLMLEEHPDSIDDGCFHNDASPAISQWNDLPGSNHAGAGSFAFADGHTEIHQWKNRGITIQRVNPGGGFATPLFSSDASGTAFQDGQWLASHSSVLLQ